MKIKNFYLTKWQLLTAFSILCVFLLDFFLPLGLSVNLLYVACFFLLIRETKKVILFFLVFTVALIFLDLAIVFRVDLDWKEYADVGMSVLAVVFGALMTIQYRNLLEKTNRERMLYIKSLEEMLFMTSHKVRKPVATFLGLINIIDRENPTKEKMTIVLDHMQTSALELDLFTKELTAFIHKIEVNHREEHEDAAG